MNEGAPLDEIVRDGEACRRSCWSGRTCADLRRARVHRAQHLAAVRRLVGRRPGAPEAAAASRAGRARWRRSPAARRRWSARAEELRGGGRAARWRVSSSSGRRAPRPTTRDRQGAAGNLSRARRGGDVVDGARHLSRRRQEVAGRARRYSTSKRTLSTRRPLKRCGLPSSGPLAIGTKKDAVLAVREREDAAMPGVADERQVAQLRLQEERDEPVRLDDGQRLAAGACADRRAAWRRSPPASPACRCA